MNFDDTFDRRITSDRYLAMA